MPRGTVALAFLAALRCLEFQVTADLETKLNLVNLCIAHNSRERRKQSIPMSK